MGVTPGEGIAIIRITNAVCPKCGTTEPVYPNFPRGAFLMKTKRSMTVMTCEVHNYEPEDFWMSCKDCGSDWHAEYKEGK
jgi:hypothetical protein